MVLKHVDMLCFCSNENYRVEISFVLNYIKCWWVAWLSGNALVSINVVTLRRPG